MTDTPWRLLLAALAALAIIVALLQLVGCAHTSSGSTEAELHTALDVLADVIAPSSRISAEACAAREQVELAEAQAGTQTPAEARAELAVIRKRCDVLGETFQRIADAHARARTLLEQGAVAEARARLEEVRALWRSLSMTEATP